MVAVVMIAGTTTLLGWIVLAATIIPLGDAFIVARHHGPRWIIWGIHGSTAALMIFTTALLLI